MKTQTTYKPDVHQQITDSIIAAIENDTGPVQMPWHKAGVANARPTNIASGNQYRGVNVLALWVAAEVNDFSSGVWGTYRQWQAKGAQVRKGEKSSTIVFYKELDIEEQNPDTGETEAGTRLFAKASRVFNADQVDGFELPMPEITAPAASVVEAETFVRNTGAAIQHGGQRAYYHPSEDIIQMPPRDIFIGTETSSPTEAYYGVLFHELTHWTGHERRCDRKFGKRFGDDAYAMEELVAELGSAFLSADKGITPEPRDDHAAYIEHWLKVMKADKKAIFTAASQAARATDFLSKLQPATTEAA